MTWHIGRFEGLCLKEFHIKNSSNISLCHPV